MRVLVKKLVGGLSILVLCSCVQNGRAPLVHIEVIRMKVGDSFPLDRNGSMLRSNIYTQESGHLFVRSTLFLDDSNMTDTAGITRVAIFLPDRLIAESMDKVVEAGKADGLRAYEYSRNDASPSDYCFQELSEGSVRIRSDGSEVWIDSHLNSPPLKGPSDVRCDYSVFAREVRFSM